MQRRKITELGAAVVTLCLAGCGGDGERRAAPQPKLPHALAVALAERSDAVAHAFEAGDSCRALTLAQDLQGRTIAAINAGRVPGPLLEPLQDRVNDLVARIECAPPRQDEDEGERGKGKKRGKKKHGKGDD
jgi:hypothetical protein